MKKFVIGSIAIVFCGISTTVSAANEVWVGKLFDITPAHDGVTLEYCKAHVPDSYETTPEMLNKEIVGKNGVHAKDLDFSIKEKGFIYFRNGKAEFSGVNQGKPWKEKVYYFAQMLNKEGPQRGIWYTKDCKGFYSAGPE
jgi:hypothetical protein